MTIDTHHHMLPDFFWQQTGNAHAPVGGFAPPQWSKEASISFMDDAGIDVAMLSISTPGVHVGDDARARTLARRCNEFAAQLVQSRPDRFGGFAALRHTEELAASEREAVLGANALKRFPRLASSASPSGASSRL